MRIFAIETSCDETALSLVDCSGGKDKPQFSVLSNLITSQIKVHRPFGGVVPQLAKREHIKNLPKLFKKVNGKAQMSKVDLIAVTVGPGLEPALWQGIEFGQALAKELHKPISGVNHMEGHMYSILLPQNAVRSHIKSLISKNEAEQPHRQIKFPAVGLVVSGGHTILVRMDSFTKWEKLGETRDDAAGEAFDKVARMLGLQYPGGPEIEKLAKKGDPNAIDFPRPMLKSANYDFSFSGLKTAVLYYLRDLHTTHYTLQTRRDVAASFQQAVMDVLIGKAMRAAKEYAAKSVFLCGGVAANKTLRTALEKAASERGIACLVPEFTFNTDNAVMIAAAAYLGSFTGKDYVIEAQPNLNL